MKYKSIGFIGGGRITRILLQAFKNKNIHFKNILVSDLNTETTAKLKIIFPEIEISDTENCSKQELVIIALHPPVITDTLEKISPFVSNSSVVISLAPKIKIATIESILKSDKVIRLIPNATSIINKGYNPICFSEGLTPVEKADFMELSGSLGNTFVVPEHKMEAYAIISAMAPTYFWFQWKKLYEIGAEIGLDKDEARKTVYETMIAAADTLFDSGLSEQDVFDLIPVKPLAENEREVENIYDQKLRGLFNKLTS
jgi:pyrroline-5-carboxylate reductase